MVEQAEVAADDGRVAVGEAFEREAAPFRIDEPVPVHAAVREEAHFTELAEPIRVGERFEVGGHLMLKVGFGRHQGKLAVADA
ncbi:hypothetical protein GCM10010403_04460 [Glycomyces rutgersensis]|uniref:Uncharacterized protein n=1 Tax=Glycomyces rutgersensis TaxID=58115 RepID=A0ABP5S3C3_9ACTN